MMQTQNGNRQRLVLFVDDEERVLRSLRRGLLDSPYTGVFATGGREALEILAREPVEVLVTDMRMPEMNGLELLREVRRRHPAVVRMVLSGYAQTSTVLAAINEGYVYRYITKPWKMGADVIAALDDAFRFHDLREEQRKLAVRLAAVNRQLEDRVRDGEQSAAAARRIAENVYRRRTETIHLAFERTRLIMNRMLSDVTSLESGGSLDVEGALLTGAIRDRCRQFLDHAGKVFLYTRIGSGMRPVNRREHVVLGELEHAIGARFTARDRRGMALVWSWDIDAPGTLPGDRELLEAMLWEVVENGMYYGRDGGRMTVAVRRPPLGGVEFTVTDDGPGVPDDECQLVVEPFTLASDNPQQERLGIGLALARAIAIRHGGDLALAPTGGAGCRVIVSLADIAD
ncbi:MAG: response regulator [Deltaproteobacteria bacterium]|nr:response regulator [Candidatus Anaeroferrophillacea bacterium]